MTRKPEIQYVGQFYIHGSEARVLAPEKEQKKPKTRLPLQYLEKIEKIYIDPVALVGIAVAVFMLVVMVLGVVQMQDAWAEYDRMEQKLETLQSRNIQLKHQYRSSYDLNDIREKAIAIGMVPMSEVETVTVMVTAPQAKPVRTFWDDVTWFFSGLFA